MTDTVNVQLLPCPFCYGEGTVSEERRSDYFSQERAFHQAMMESRK